MKTRMFIGTLLLATSLSTPLAYAQPQPPQQPQQQPITANTNPCNGGSGVLPPGYICQNGYPMKAPITYPSSSTPSSTAGSPTTLPPTPNCNYVAGVYTCVNFTNDYTATLTAAGIPAHGMVIHVNDPGPQCDLHHAINIAAVACPAPNANPQYPCYEVVEGQNGKVYGPWQQYNTNGPVVPVPVLTAILANFGLPSSCMPFLQNVIIYPQGQSVPGNAGTVSGIYLREPSATNPHIPVLQRVPH